MSGLLHLVEAATVLSQLVSQTNQPRRAPASASTSALPLSSAPEQAAVGDYTPTPAARPHSRRIPSHTISDDDDAMAAAVPDRREMAALRENHLEALRAAAVSAGMVPAERQQPPVPQATAYAVNRHPRCQPQRRQQQQRVVATPDRAPAQVTPSPPQPTPGLDASKEMFPLRLHALLSDPTVRDVISWLPHGRSFVVLRPDVFAERVLPRYFAPEGSNSLNAKTSTVVGKDGSLQAKNKSPGVHKYPSFTRKLNRWGFRQISRGPDAGAFCHEMFQRDDPNLCRGMVCKKSRKSKKATIGGVVPDDLVSVSSASTMGTRLSDSSGEKRPYSSTVTVSTAGGAASHRTLPFKKRKNPVRAMAGASGIPAMISHRNHPRAQALASSVTESDATSDNGSVSSGGLSNKASRQVPAKAPPPVAKSKARANSSATPQSKAMETLISHFQEQHRAFALASLMENSRVAMDAAGLTHRANHRTNQVKAQVRARPSVSVPPPAHVQAPHAPRRTTPSVIGAVTTHATGVFAATVDIPEEKKMPATVDGQATAQSATDAARSALYKAYLQALSDPAP